jgi:hypothetical protein
MSSSTAGDETRQEKEREARSPEDSWRGRVSSPLMENLMAGFSSTAEEDSTCMSDGCWSAGFDMTVAAEADLRRRAQMRSRRRGASVLPKRFKPY